MIIITIMISVTFLWSKICSWKMEEIQLENEAVDWPAPVISLAEVDLNETAVTEKEKKEKRHFLLSSDRILLRIVKVKAICRVITRGLCKDKFVNLQTEVPYGLLWKIFNGIRNLINAKYSKINTYAAFNKVQICSTKRMQLALL